MISEAYNSLREIESWTADLLIATIATVTVLPIRGPIASRMMKALTENDPYDDIMLIDAIDLIWSAH